MFMQKKVDIELDFGADISVNENEAGEKEPILNLFFGLSNDDELQNFEVSFKNLLTNFIENETIPNGTARQEHKDFLLSSLDAFQKNIDDARQTIIDMPLFCNDKQNLNKKKTKKNK